MRETLYDSDGIVYLDRVTSENGEPDQLKIGFFTRSITATATRGDLRILQDDLDRLIRDVQQIKSVIKGFEDRA